MLGFFAVQVLIRLIMSGNLEVDEAQFVGATGFRLGFGNSHPPLYNWLITLVYIATGGSWVASVSLVKNLFLAGTFIVAWDLLRRLKANPMAGLMAAAGLALLPQVIWQGQVTLAHSVAAGFATLATLHAAWLWLMRRSARTAVWLGVAVAVGVLSKYNYLLFLGAFVLAAATLPDIRMRLDRRTGWLAAAVALVLVAPHAVWAVTHLDVTVERMNKLYSERNPVVGFDLPVVGVDGLVSLGLALLAWGAPLALVWAALARWTKPLMVIPDTETWDFSRAFAALCGRAALIGLVALAVIVFAGDMHKVHERYLTPLLLPGVVWLALRFPLEDRPAGRGILAALASVLFVASMIAIPAVVAFGPSRLAYPYADIADDLAETDVVPTDILANRQDLAANVALLMPDGRIWSGPSDRRVIVLWRRGELPPPFLVDRLGEGYAADGTVRTLTHAYRNWSGKRDTLHSQVFVRKPQP